MQVTNIEIAHQQAILKHLGFYKGKVDGIWGAATITAKREFEFKREFSPAIPNNGLPFGLSDRLPKGMNYKRIGNDTLLSHVAVQEEDLKRLLGKSDSQVAIKDPVVAAGPIIADAPIVDTPILEVVPAPAVNQSNQQPNKNQQHTRR